MIYQHSNFKNIRNQTEDLWELRLLKMFSCKSLRDDVKISGKFNATTWQLVQLGPGCYMCGNFLFFFDFFLYTLNIYILYIYYISVSIIIIMAQQKHDKQSKTMQNFHRFPGPYFCSFKNCFTESPTSDVAFDN